MAELQLRGKGVAGIARDVAEGFFSITPLVLKKVEPEGYRALFYQLKKIQTQVRGERFPQNDTLALRYRNARLQRLHQALTILEYSAKEKRISLA
ncbi:MAG TPA: hypothetical protein VLB09_07010 [Nitrospiria bacterium]|nr:hypothetical protein [Nitrospiria bacterium]